MRLKKHWLFVNSLNKHLPLILQKKKKNEERCCSQSILVFICCIPGKMPSNHEQNHRNKAKVIFVSRTRHEYNFSRTSKCKEVAVLFLEFMGILTKSILPKIIIFHLTVYWVYLVPGRSLCNEVYNWLGHSYIQKQPPWIFNHILNTSEEIHCLSSINQPMIICQGYVHHRPCNDVTSNNHRAVNYRVHAKDCRLSNRKRLEKQFRIRNHHWW